MTERPLCPDCVAFWAKHTRVNADGETETNTIGRICPCSPPKGPTLAVVGTTSGAKQWTPEQFAEWLRSMGCPESGVPGVTEWFNRHSPVVPIAVQAKEPA